MFFEVCNHDERRQNDREDTGENPEGHLFLLDVRKNESANKQDRTYDNARRFELEKSDGEGRDGQINEPRLCDRCTWTQKIE